MQAIMIEGKKTAEKTLASLRERVSPQFYPFIDFSSPLCRPPSLHIILVGENSSSQIYVQRKLQVAKECGVQTRLHQFDSDVNHATILEKIQTLSADNQVDAILLQMPLPPHLNSQDLIDTIHPEKDVDGLTSMQLGKLASNHPSATIACTPLGIWAMLQDAQITLENKEVVIIGRSRIVGRPLELLFSSPRVNANVTILHSKSAQNLENFKTITRRADVLILAAGQKEFFGKDFIKDRACVIDVGIHTTQKNSLGPKHLVGDGQRHSLQQKASFLSPVPGGVGPMTVASLMYNCWKLKLSPRG